MASSSWAALSDCFLGALRGSLQALLQARDPPDHKGETAPALASSMSHKIRIKV
jgi:hypothetical protein